MGIAFGRIEDVFGDELRTRKWSACGDFSDGDSVTGAPFGSDASYYRSFKLADVNGDGLADACARGASGVVCAKNNGGGRVGAYKSWKGDDFTDGTGWLRPQYGTTVQYADINGDGVADVCGGGSAGLRSGLANAHGEADGFGPSWAWSSGFDDGTGWAANESYYKTVHLADVDGDGWADVCGRASEGIECAINSRWGWFGGNTLWLGGEFSDATGWLQPQYGTTVQLAGINGDGRADICRRGTDGMRCALAKASGDGFEGPRGWS